MDWFLYANGLRHERVNGKLLRQPAFKFNMADPYSAYMSLLIYYHESHTSSP